MADDFVELAAETVNHLTDRYWEQGYDKYTKVVNGTPVDKTYTPYKRNSGDQASRSTASRPGLRSSAAVDATAPGPPSSAPSTRRRQRNRLPSPERDPDRISSAFPRVRDLSEDRQSETSCEVIRAYERETDDPSRKPESVLSPKQLRRDSAAMTSYNDGYEQSQYAGSARPRSQPPRTKYYDDENDSDYDERTGRRYRGGSGRGWGDDRDDRNYERDDRNYDRVVETTERYRGPPVDRPWDPARQGSYRSNDGAVTQYGGARRSQDQQSAYSRRSKSRGRGDRDRERDRSYSRSRSRSREHETMRDRFDDTFDRTPRGLGVGLAGAVIGGLAGRELGNTRHQKRDMIIGAIVGGLGANAAENKWHNWREDKKERLERDEDRWEQRWDGRSRSSVR